MSKLIKFCVLFFVFGVLFGQLVNSLQCFNCDSNRDKECHQIKDISPIKPVECRPNVVKQNSPEWLTEIISVSNFGTELEITVPMVCQKIIATNEKSDLLTYRGCQMHGGKKDLCSIAKANAVTADNGIKIESCIVCGEDSCNRAGKKGGSGIILFTVFLAAIKII